MDCSMPGFPVHHQLSELAQTHVHWVSDAIHPSHPLSSPFPPAFNVPLVSLIFLKRSLVLPILLFSSVSLHCSLRKPFLSLLSILWTAFRWLYLSFSPLSLASLLFSGIFKGSLYARNDAKAETPVLWPPYGKSWLIGKDSDAGRDWGQEEKGTTEDEMAGWHHWLDGRESQWTPGVGEGQGGLACCDSQGRKELDMTERLI